MKSLGFDIAQGLRQLKARSQLTLLTILLLSVGLGSTLFIFAAINDMLIKEPPFPAADRLYNIGAVNPLQPGFVGRATEYDYVDLKTALRSVEEMAAYAPGTVNLAEGSNVLRHDGVFVSDNLFAMLGINAHLGRTIGVVDEPANAPLAVVLSHKIWRDRFGADPQVIGRAVRMNAKPAIVVGVMPEQFSFPFQAEIWVSARFRNETPLEQIRYPELLVRARPDISTDALNAELTQAFERIRSLQPDLRRDARLGALPIMDRFVNPHTKSIIMVLLTTALAVLAVVCTNVANLQLGAMTARAREYAVRSALGASRTRVVRSVLIEMLIVGAVSCGLALWFAHLAGAYAKRTFDAAGDSAAYWIQYAVDWRIGLVGVVIAAGAALLAGLLPALRAGGYSMARSMAESGRVTGVSRLSRGLIVFQITMSCMLLVGAGMTWRVLSELTRTELGMAVAAEDLLTARVAIFPEQFPSPGEQARFFSDLGDRLRREPDVLAATVSESLPGAIGAIAEVLPEGADADAANMLTTRSSVDDAFLSALGIELVRGRFFDARDQEQSLRVAVVDQHFVDQRWPGEDGLNRQIQLEGGGAAYTVVGVIKPLRFTDPDDDILPALLTSMRQAPVRYASIMLRIRGTPMHYAPRLAEVVRELNADTPVYWVQTLRKSLDDDNVGDRFVARLFGLFGLIGLVLAAAGLYGVLSQSIGSRTREIGVRRAIGANRVQVMRDVSRGAIQLSAWSVGIGLVLALPWGMMLAAGAERLDPLKPDLYLVVGLVVAIAAAIAIYLPARRATSVDPMQALRSD